MKTLTVLILLLVVLVGTAWAYNCGICNMGMYFTGRTQTEWGKLLYEYRCPVGHVWWIVK